MDFMAATTVLVVVGGVLPFIIRHIGVVGMAAQDLTGSTEDPSACGIISGKFFQQYLQKSRRCGHPQQYTSGRRL